MADTWGVADSGQTWAYAPALNGAAPLGTVHYFVDQSSGVITLPADATHTQWPAMELPTGLTAGDWVALVKMQFGTTGSGSLSQSIGFWLSSGSARVVATFQPWSAGSEVALVLTTPGNVTTTYTAHVTGLPGSGNPSSSLWYWMRVEGLADGGRMRWWPDGTTEPTSWTIEQHPTAAMTYDTFLAMPKVVNGTAQSSFFFANLNGTGTYTSVLAAQSGQPYPLTSIANGDGATTSFTVPTGYQSGSLFVFVDDVMQIPTEVSPSAGTFSLSFAPITGETVYAFWVVY